MNAPFLHRYPNTSYLQYMKDVIGILNQHDIVALKLSRQTGVFQSMVNRMNEAYELSQGSGLTEEIIKLDEKRNRAILGLKNVTEGYTYHYEPNIANAARLLNDSIRLYIDEIRRVSFMEQTIAFSTIIKDWETNGVLIDAMSILNLGNWLAELKNFNTGFSYQYSDCVDDVAANLSMDVPKIRLEVTEVYRTLINHIRVHAAFGGVQTYTIILNEIEKIVRKYNQTIDDSKPVEATRYTQLSIV